jgi:hypothetical protein
VFSNKEIEIMKNEGSVAHRDGSYVWGESCNLFYHQRGGDWCLLVEVLATQCLYMLPMEGLHRE